MNMRFAALAAVLALTSVGCTAVRPGCGDACGDVFGPAGCGEPCHVATSRHAPRPGELAGRCPTGIGLLDQVGWTQKGCSECVGGCGDGCGMFQRGGGCCGGGCNSCVNNAVSSILDCHGCNGCGGFGGSGDGCYNFQPGPPVGQVAYPYYTTRGPRDFLMCNPPSIGPR